MGCRPRTARTHLSIRRACQVVPDIPSFAVDDGFTYLVPETADIHIGSRVRVRVSGRRLKGFVTAVFEAPEERKLLPVDAVSGDIPSFDESMLAVLRWAATHYVSPLSVILRRTIPPNIPRTPNGTPRQPVSRLSGVVVVVSSSLDHATHLEGIVAEAAAVGGSTMIIAPTVLEVGRVSDALKNRFSGHVVSATSSSSGKDSTKAWSRAATSGDSILVGTREIVLWPVAGLVSMVVVEDSRRVMKSPSTPTLGVREIAVKRSGINGNRLTFLSPLPSLETLALRPKVIPTPNRSWPLVEVADRAEEPPSRSVLLDRTRIALAGATGKGLSAFVLVPSRGYAPAFRCVRCGELRRCTVCGTAATRRGDCRRCGAVFGECVTCAGQHFEPLGAGLGSVRDAIARSVGDAVGVSGEHRPITVGSERDIVTQKPIDLAVAVDIDGMAMAPTYRASEDALRLLVRTANLVRRGRGNRLIVQTALPDQPVVEALRSGRPTEFLRQQLTERRRSSFPPAGELIALEVDRAIEVGTAVEDAVSTSATVLGPAAMKDRDRWLIQAKDLTPARAAVRRLVGSLRDRGARVRVDADPIDL
ncbi:MAG: hypothetical protein ACC654_12450 [Acidimicrobiia bacterium]